MIITHLLISSLISLNAYCVDGMRGDPLLIIQGPDRNNIEKKHYIYYLPNQKGLCEWTASYINAGEVKVACGCKQLKVSGIRDRTRLRCASIRDNKVYSRTIAIYYYHRELVGRCEWMREYLEKKL